MPKKTLFIYQTPANWLKANASQGIGPGVICTSRVAHCCVFMPPYRTFILSGDIWKAIKVSIAEIP